MSSISMWAASALGSTNSHRRKKMPGRPRPDDSAAIVSRRTGSKYWISLTIGRERTRDVSPVKLPIERIAFAHCPDTVSAAIQTRSQCLNIVREPFAASREK